MADLKETPLWQKVLIIVVLFVLVFFGLNSLVFKSKRAAIADYNAKITSLSAEVQRLHGFEAKKAKYEDECKTLKEELDKLKAMLPKSKETDLLARKLELLAKNTSGLEIKLFEPQQKKMYDFYYELPIKFKVLGNYHALGKFFEKVANFERILNVYNLKCKGLNSGDASGFTLKASFIASTFVYIGEDSETIK